MNEDMLKGIITIRETYIRAMKETEFFCADEILYPENYRYLSDVEHAQWKIRSTVLQPAALMCL